jgi:hypothetical protein
MIMEVLIWIKSATKGRNAACSLSQHSMPNLTRECHLSQDY